ncbi:NUDIX domain-containing protein [Campylobacter helveticus]|uniref:NUDIX hydrolase n=1 Tax=Campylobacter helveticus TaxID=28898 RepID=A0ABY3L0Q7_9BACT|nr:NUDIX domain-containing protein [Campylobacter helveticus]ARE80461.1 nudix-type nucleoside diphosphatase [Campylobacter helveticus]MCR2039801.1 NUDIX domain-containing protein [Campylobacter helveticus]MCR2054347.1 NUDIX domain-containing protein [Campylobacter helveticus]MCR2063904.1 NUDIX domain-containing protein [Campylobacter helveticus]TNB59441.1 NUDIX hydrolase [Campylobacter helveticus]
MKFKNLKELPFTPSIYIKPKRFAYESKGKNYTWDFIEAKDSVSVLLYHKSLESFIFVRQFRIPLWYHQTHDENYKENANMGYTIELCSGLVDKNLSLEEIAKEECVEELGFLPKKLEKIGDYYTGFGSGVSKQSFYFAVVDEEDKIAQGGGVDGEQIEAIYVKVVEFEEFIKKQIRTPLLDFAYLWFMKNHFKTR